MSREAHVRFCERAGLRCPARLTQIQPAPADSLALAPLCDELAEIAAFALRFHTVTFQCRRSCKVPRALGVAARLGASTIRGSRDC